MRYCIFSILLIFSLACCAQERVRKTNREVEPHLLGFQAGSGSIQFHEEFRLARTISLRFEAGLYATYVGGSLTADTFEVGLVPALAFSPRIYHNLARRDRLGKRTDLNTGNFFELYNIYRLDEIIHLEDGLLINSFLALMPSYGFRRNIGDRFNYELAGGVGPGYQLDRGYQPTEFGWAYNIRLRLGYTF
jgi:hypothetical protein